MNKYFATAAVGLLLTTTSFAVAQTSATAEKPDASTSVGQAPASDAMTNVVVQPAQPTSADQAGAPAGQATISIVPVGSANVNAAPAMPVPEMPKADPAFFEHIADAFNSKNIDTLVDSYSKDGFVVVTDKGEIITDKEALKHFYASYLSGEKKVTASINMNKIMDIAPGVAVAYGKLSMQVEGEKHAMESSVTSTIKYENGAWKIVSKQASMIEMLKAEEHKHGGYGFKMFLTLIVGAVIGFFACKYVSKKSSTPTV